MPSVSEPPPAARAGLVRSFGAKPHAPPKPKTTLSPGITPPRAGDSSQALMVPLPTASVNDGHSARNPSRYS